MMRLNALTLGCLDELMRKPCCFWEDNRDNLDNLLAA